MHTCVILYTDIHIHIYTYIHTCMYVINIGHETDFYNYATMVGEVSGLCSFHLSDQDQNCARDNAAEKKLQIGEGEG